MWIVGYILLGFAFGFIIGAVLSARLVKAALEKGFEKRMFQDLQKLLRARLDDPLEEDLTDREVIQRFEEDIKKKEKMFEEVRRQAQEKE